MPNQAETLVVSGPLTVAGLPCACRDSVFDPPKTFTPGATFECPLCNRSWTLVQSKPGGGSNDPLTKADVEKPAADELED